MENKFLIRNFLNLTELNSASFIKEITILFYWNQGLLLTSLTPPYPSQPFHYL